MEPSPSSETLHTSLSCTDYPHIKFWTRKEWADYTSNEIATTDKPHGKVRSSQGINVTMRYVEGENGEAVDEHVATEIQQYAWSIWVHIVNTNRAPPKWGDVGVKIPQIYCQHMYSKFLILQFWKLDWKLTILLLTIIHHGIAGEPKNQQEEWKPKLRRKQQALQKIYHINVPTINQKKANQLNESSQKNGDGCGWKWRFTKHPSEPRCGVYISGL